MQVCGQQLATQEATRVQGAAERAVVSLLKTPLISHGNALTIVLLPHYTPLMSYLPYSSRKEVALLAARMMQKGKTPLRVGFFAASVYACLCLEHTCEQSICI
jgi:hypothetical protein